MSNEFNPCGPTSDSRKCGILHEFRQRFAKKTARCGRPSLLFGQKPTRLPGTAFAFEYTQVLRYGRRHLHPTQTGNHAFPGRLVPKRPHIRPNCLILPEPRPQRPLRYRASRYWRFYEKRRPDHLASYEGQRLFASRIPVFLWCRGCIGRVEFHRIGAGSKCLRIKATPAGRLAALPGMHLLQRVIYPIFSPDRCRYHLRHSLARLY